MGQLPVNFTQRSAESDAWTLHKCISLNGNDNGSSTGGRLSSDFSPFPSRCHLHLANTSLSTDENGQTDSVRKVGDNSPGVAIKSTHRRRLMIVRHAERVDFTFGNWIPVCFDSSGNYRRRDLNQPQSLAKRPSPMDYLRDSPLTNIGMYQASLTGRGLREAGIRLHAVFVSPAYRCVQTAVNILTELELLAHLPLNVEPGLFEWLNWYPPDSFPVWLTPGRWTEIGLNVNVDYKPVLTVEQLAEKSAAKESLEEYYQRKDCVTRAILGATEGHVLLVGHASSLDTCSRLLSGKCARSEDDFLRLNGRTPYCGLLTLEEDPEVDGKWDLRRSEVPSLIHSDNSTLDLEAIMADAPDDSVLCLN